MSKSRFLFRAPLFLQVLLQAHYHADAYFLKLKLSSLHWTYYKKIISNMHYYYLSKNTITSKWKTNFLLILHLVIQTASFSAPLLDICQEGIELGCRGRNSTANRQRKLEKVFARYLLPNLTCSHCWMLGPLMKLQESAPFTELQGLHVIPDFLQIPACFPLSKLQHPACSNGRRDTHPHFGKCNLCWDRVTQSCHWIRPFRKRETQSS